MSQYTEAEHEAIIAASQARSELEQTERAFDAVRAEMFEALAGTRLGESALREQLYMGINALDRVRGALRAAVAAGDVAEHAATIRSILTEDAAG